MFAYQISLEENSGHIPTFDATHFENVVFNVEFNVEGMPQVFSNDELKIKKVVQHCR